MIAAVLMIWPVKYQSTRAMTLLFIGGAVVGVLMRCWPMPKLKWFLPSIILLLSLFLLPGDLAVTSDGVHIMAYLGNEQWFEADPAFGEVVILRKGESDQWLQTSVELLRWRCLGNDQGDSSDPKN